MIDIHHHCLPGIDDGPREMDEAVAMCHAALDEGIETIIATPHVLRGRWRPKSIAELNARLEDLRTRVGDRPRLILGSEYFFSHDIVEEVEAGTAVVPLAGSRYVLVEFAAQAIPPHIEQPFYRLQLAGHVPVIAHPERNLVLQSKPELMEALLLHGARMQITAGSLTGEFGRKAKASAESLLRLRRVHFVATDAHNTTSRPPRARAAMAILTELVGECVARSLTHDNPLAVVENRTLPYDPEPLPEPDHGFFATVRSFLRR